MGIKLFSLSALFLTFIMTFSFFSCTIVGPDQEKSDLPSVMTTLNENTITATTVRTGLVIIDNGGSPITEKGIVYSTSRNPSVSHNSGIIRDTNMTSATQFSTTITELRRLETYYVRAYAINRHGTSYGEEISFTTIRGDEVSLALSRALDNNILEFTSGGGSHWFRQTEVSLNGTDAAQSGAIGHRDTSWFETVVRGPAVLSFYWKVSSELNSDYLKLFLNNSVEASISGETEWELYELIIPEGVNTVRWAYIKDGSVVRGEDAAWVDQVVLTRVEGASAPTVTTNTVTEITHRNALAGGNVTDDGGFTVTQKGVVWSDESNPTLNDNLGYYISDSTGVGEFEAIISGLSDTTRYFARAFAINAIDTAYGNQVVFTTTEPVTIDLATSLDNTDLTFTIGGDANWFGQADSSYDGLHSAQSGAITHNQSTWLETVVEGPAIVTFWWNVSSESNCDYLSFYINGTRDDRISGTGGRWREVTAVIPEGESTLRWEYSKDGSVNRGNDAGWLDRVTVTTIDDAELPVISTREITNVDAVSASSGGDIEEEGNMPITQRGIVWARTSNPTLESRDSLRIVTGTTAGFTANLVDLEPGETYYVRAFASSALGTSYGEQIMFTTDEATLPEISTREATDITINSASTGGITSSTGNTPVTQRGVVFGTMSNPTLDNNDELINYTGSLTSFSSTLEDLEPATTYYVRAFITNSAGTAYGEVESFTTLDIELPEVYTNSPSNISALSAILGGLITSQGTTPIIRKGVIISADNSSVTIDNYDFIEESDATGESFTIEFEDLTEQTSYYARAFLETDEGFVYGTFVLFTTHELIPAEVETLSASSISVSGANAGVNITNRGNSDIVEAGLVVNTTDAPTVDNNSHIFTETSVSSDLIPITMTGLTHGTTYHARAYVITAAGTSYGNQISFETLVREGNVDLSFDTGGDAQWFLQTEETYLSSSAWQSGLITHNQSTWLETTIEGPGTLSFYWKVSSESGYDYLNFFIGNTRVERISGTDGEWEEVVIDLVASSTNTIRWTYSKDGSNDRGQDCGWVDSIIFLAD